MPSPPESPTTKEGWKALYARDNAEIFKEEPEVKPMKPIHFPILSCSCPKGRKWCQVLGDDCLWVSDNLGCDWAKEMAKTFMIDEASSTSYFAISEAGMV